VTETSYRDRCDVCNQAVSLAWDFCPYCGTGLSGGLRDGLDTAWDDTS